METVKISLNKPIYDTEELDINWSECVESGGVLTVKLNNNAGYSLQVGDFIRFDRYVTIENENPFGKNTPDGFEYSHVGCVAYDDCEVLSVSGDSAFTITAPKRKELYLNPAESVSADGKTVFSFKTNHDFFYQDIAQANGLMKLSYSGQQYTFSATTTSASTDGVPQFYTIQQQSIGENCGGSENIYYDYYFLPTRESRYNVKVQGIVKIDETLPVTCNQNAFYFVNENGKCTPWVDTVCGETKTVVSKYVGYWKVPVAFSNNSDYAHLYQESNINQLYSEKIKSSVIPDFINMEKVKYKPIISGNTIELVSGLTFNLHFRVRSNDDDWHIIKSSGWNSNTSTNESDGLCYLGFVDNDVKYQKMKVQKSFIRLSFYRSGSEGKFNPLDASLLYYSTVFFDSGELFGKFNKKRTELLKSGDKWEETDTSKHVLQKSIESTSTVRVDSKITIFNEYNSTKSSEGFNIYLFADDSSENVPETIYMKVEFNHAGYGRTIPMCISGGNDAKSSSGITTDEYYDKLYIPLKIVHIGDGYYYSFDDIYEELKTVGGNGGRVVNDIENRSITFNLYEPKLTQKTDF